MAAARWQQAEVAPEATAGLGATGRAPPVAEPGDVAGVDGRESLTGCRWTSAFVPPSGARAAAPGLVSDEPVPAAVPEAERTTENPALPGATDRPGVAAGDIGVAGRMAEDAGPPNGPVDWTACPGSVATARSRPVAGRYRRQDPHGRRCGRFVRGRRPGSRRLRRRVLRLLRLSAGRSVRRRRSTRRLPADRDVDRQAVDDLGGRGAHRRRTGGGFTGGHLAGLRGGLGQARTGARADKSGGRNRGHRAGLGGRGVRAERRHRADAPPPHFRAWLRPAGQWARASIRTAPAAARPTPAGPGREWHWHHRRRWPVELRLRTSAQIRERSAEAAGALPSRPTRGARARRKPAGQAEPTGRLCRRRLVMAAPSPAAPISTATISPRPEQRHRRQPRRRCGRRAVRRPRPGVRGGNGVRSHHSARAATARR